MGVRVLAVGPGLPVAVLDREPGAMMEASQTAFACILGPHRPPVLHLDRLDGTPTGAEAATGAVLFQMEVAGPPVALRHLSGEEACRIGLLGFHEIALVPRQDPGDDRIQILVRLPVLFRHELRVAQVEHRGPGVRHLDAERCIQADVVFAKYHGGLLPAVSGRRAVGGHEEGVSAVIHADLLEEPLHYGREAPEVDGGNQSEHALALQGPGIQSLDGYGGILRGDCYGLRDMLAVAGCGEVTDHGSQNRIWLFDVCRPSKGRGSTSHDIV